MSLKNENGKLHGWQKQYGIRRIRLHPEIGNKIIDIQSVKLYKMLRDDVRDKIASDAEMISLIALGPKRLYKMGLLKSNGWRRGFTK